MCLINIIEGYWLYYIYPFYFYFAIKIYINKNIILHIYFNLPFIFYSKYYFFDRAPYTNIFYKRKTFETIEYTNTNTNNIIYLNNGLAYKLSNFIF